MHTSLFFSMLLMLHLPLLLASLPVNCVMEVRVLSDEGHMQTLENDMSFMGFIFFILVTGSLAGIVAFFLYQTLRKVCCSKAYNRVAKYEEEELWGDVELGSLYEETVLTEREQEEIDEVSFILPQAY